MARPTKYKTQFAEQARFIMESLGATEEQLAKALGVTAGTIYNWKQEHPEFLQAVLEGKAAFEEREVDTSLLAMVRGYWFQEEIYDKDQGVIVRLWKFRHPEVKAAALWKANRCGWRLPVPMPAAGAGPRPPILPAGELGNEGPPGMPDPLTTELDAAAQERVNELALEILESRYGTRITRQVESKEVREDGH